MKKALNPLIGFFIGIIIFYLLLMTTGFADFVYQKELDSYQKEVDKIKYDCNEYIADNYIIEKDSVKIINFPIFEKNYHCIKQALKNKNKLTIIFSDGGLSAIGYMLGKYMKENNISVHVKYSCFSACVDLLVYSNNSSVCSFTNVGVHQSASLNKNKSFLSDYIMDHFSKISSRHTISSYIENGVNSKHIENVINKTTYDNIYILSEDELIQNNYIDNIIDC